MGAEQSTANATPDQSKANQEAAIPTEMKAVRLVQHVKGYDNLEPCFELATVPTPVPADGEVLVKVACSPINPSDLSTMKGTYNSKQREELPCLLGFEASGTVVANGGGVLGWFLMGKRVSIVSTKGGRMWCEYAVVPAFQCVQLPDTVSFEEGCSCFVNPLTVLSFLEIAQNGGHKAIVHTAAASALGKMLVRLCNANSIDVICVVRRADQAEELKKVGAKHIVSTSDEKWIEEFGQMCTQLECRLAFDAVAGDLTGTILARMPSKSAVYVYGGLAEQPVSNIRVSDLIFSDKKVLGYWLTAYLNTKSLLGKKAMLDKASSLLASHLKTEVRVVYPLHQAAAGVSDYVNHMSLGKVAFSPLVQEKCDSIPKPQPPVTSNAPVPAPVEEEKKDAPAVQNANSEAASVPEPVQVPEPAPEPAPESAPAPAPAPEQADAVESNKPQDSTEKPVASEPAASN